MTIQHLIYLYYLTLGLISANVLLVIFKKYKLINPIGIAVVICTFCSYICAYLLSGHVPVYNKFATLQNVVLITSFLGIIYNKKPGNKNENINSLWFIIFFLQAFVLLKEFKLNSNYFMYDKLYVVLFFQFRIAAVALFVFSIGNYLAVVCNKFSDEAQAALIHRARNYTILGAAIYLAGEFSGSYWCFVWFGDPWHWSKGFFLASTMFLLSMLGSHLPAKYSNTSKKKAVINLVALGSILTIYLISH